MSEPRRITERYRLERRISVKDSGHVFRALDTRSNATVAVKLINQEETEEQRALIEADLALLQSLHHPALPRLLDFGITTAGSPFLVTEYLPGDDLAALLEAPPGRLLSHLRQVAEGLDALAARGLTVPNLGLDNVRIATGPDGDPAKNAQAKILGFGGSTLRPLAGSAGTLRSGLRAFGELVVRVLDLPVPAAGGGAVLPDSIEAALAEPDRLRELLEAAFRDVPAGRLTSWRDVGLALRPTAAMPPPPPPPARRPTGETARLQAQAPPPPPLDHDATAQMNARPGTVRIPLKELEKSGPFPPFQPPPPPPPAPRSETPPPPPRPEMAPPRAQPAPVAAMLPPAVPLPALPPPVATRQPALAPSSVAPAAAPSAGAASAPPATRPGMSGLRLALLVGIPLVALALAGGGFLAWRWLRPASAPPTPPPPVVQPHPNPAMPPVEPSAPTPAQPQIVRAEEALTPLQGQKWAESLSRGLARGDMRLLRATLAQTPDAATLTADQKKGLARARRLVDLDAKLTKAERAKNPGEILRQAGLLLAELPGNARALQIRRETAAAVLAESDARFAQGQFAAAQEALEPLRAAWSDHPGLAERLDKIVTQQRYDVQMEGALAAAQRAERAGRALEGLQALDRVHPNERWTARFQQARERLQTLLTSSDQDPPRIAMTGPAEPVYKKGETVTLPLRITDDLGVEGAEAYARPEGGGYQKITLRHLGGNNYEIEIRPDLHLNKDIDLYVTATDRSGHTGNLGSAQRPFKIKRKKWFS